jgi:filamentous hemagglutinin family protein
MAQRFSVPRSRWLCSAAAAFTLIGGVAKAQEMPTGGSVAAGAATITANPGAMTVRQDSARAVIDWKSFSIGAGGKVTIDQRDAKSALLNRVTGNDISTIAGSLTANGQVFLVNGNGVIVGGDGRIEARGGFVASTLDITNDDFMTGRLRFGGNGMGAVINRGMIQGGAVALLGANVANEGLIVSSLGQVALGSGRQATLDLNGDGLLQVALPADATDANGRPLVANSGRIESRGGIVVLKAATARDAVRQAVNMSGVIRATEVASDGGAVVFDGGEGGVVRLTGAVDVSGINGGRIDATGQSVLLEGGRLIATGDARGGLIRLGGAFQGGNPSSTATAALSTRFNDRFGEIGGLRASESVATDAASLIDVSGGTAGGTAVLWSTRSTDQQGSVIANAGAVELSSLGHLTTKLSAVRTGAGGILLLDPKNISVLDDNGFGGLTPTTLPAGGTVDYADPGADPATTYFRAGDILSQMNAGTDVVLRASNDVSWQATNASVDFGFASAGRSGALTLAAGRSVSVGGALTLYSSSLTLIANDTLANGVVDADRDFGAAEIDTFNATISAQVGAGQTAGDIRFVLGTGAGLTNRTIATSNRIGGLSGNNITLDDSGQGTAWSFFASQDPGRATETVAVTARGAVSITGAIVARSSGGLTLSGNSVTWTDEATRSISGEADAPIRFVAGGVTTRYGVTAGLAAEGGEGGGGGAPVVADLTRVGLGKGGAYDAIAYGDANPAAVRYRITAGALRGTDTLADVAGGLSIVAGALPAANASVGTYQVTTAATVNASGALRGYFLNLTAASDTLAITPKALTATVSNGSYTYGTPAALVGLTGVINGDVVAPVATLDAANTIAMAANGSGFGFADTVAAGNHSYALTGLTGGGASNYSLAVGSLPTGSIAIAARPLTYAIADAGAVYGTIASPVSTLSGGIVGSDVVALTLASSGLATTARVGSYTVIGSGLTGAAAANYTLASTGNDNGALTITAKPLTYTGSSITGTYGTAVSVTAPTLSGVINGDRVAASATVNGSTPSFTDATPAGTYVIGAALAGADVANYSIASTGNTAGMVTIQRRAVTFSVNDATSVYGSTAPVLTVTGLTGFDTAAPRMLADGSFVDLLPVGGNTYAFAANAGVRAFTFEGLGGAAASNYSIDLGAVNRAGTYTVTPKPVTYAIDTSTQQFRVTASGPTITLNGVLTADLANVSAAQLTAGGTVIADNSGFFSLNAGSYVLAIGGLSGVAAGNYALASSGNVTGLRIVQPRAISFTVGDGSSTYGTLASLPSASLSDTYFRDDVQAVVQTSLSGAAISLSDRTAVGTYAVGVTGLTGANAGNYVLSSSGNTSGQLTIAAKPINYAIGDSSIVYGQTPGNLAATLTGVLTGDTVIGEVGLSSGVQNGFVDTLPSIFRVTGSPYQLAVRALTGTAAANYAIASSGNTIGTVTVAPKPITYNVGALTQVYGSASEPGDAALVGVVNGDDVRAAPITVTVNGVSGQSSNGLSVGTYAGQVGGILGADTGNYVLSATGNSDAVLTITPKPIFGSVTRVFRDRLSYGTLPTGLSLFSATLGGLIDFDVHPVLTSTAQTASGAGFLKAGVYTGTVSGLSGSAARNYVLAGSFDASFTVTPAERLTSSSSFVSSTYGTLPIVPRATLDGVFAGDQVTAGAPVVVRNTGEAVTLAEQTPVGLYIATVTLSGADAANYSGAGGSTLVNILPKTLVATGAASTVTYGNTVALPAPTLAGVVGADVVGVNYSVGFSDRTHAGTYSVPITPILTGAGASNYVLAPDSTPGTLTVTPRTIGYTLDYTARSGVYGDQFASPVRLTGLLAGDDARPTQVFGVLTAKPANSLDSIGDGAVLTGLQAGTYSVVASAFGGALQLSGANAGDYRVAAGASGTVSAALGATITVAPRALTYSLTTAPSIVYGSVPTVAATFGNTLAGLPLSYSFAATGTAGSVDLGAPASNARVAVGSYTVAPVLTGQSAANYTWTGQSVPLSVTPKPLSVAINTTNVVYGDGVPNFLSLSGLLAGDAVTPNATFGSTIFGTVRGAAGFDLGPVTLDVGSPQFAISSLSGAQASNYSLANAGLTGRLAITPRTITYSVAGATGQYGGITAQTFEGCDGDVICALRTNTGFTTGTVTFGNIVAADRDAVSATVLLSDGKQTFAYATNTPVGQYLEIVSGIQGTKAGNYVLATTGNTAGLMDIRQAWVKADISSGGRIYNNGVLGDFLSVGTPGIATILRSYNETFSRGVGTSNPVTGFVPGDDVNVVVTVFNQDGSLYTGGPNFPVGSYAFRATSLSGAQAGNYKLMPPDGSFYSSFIGSTPGTFLVQDSGFYSFSFLTDTPSAAYTPPASVTTFHIDTSAQAEAGAEAGTERTATSFTATAGANAGAQVSASYGTVAVSAAASADAQALAEFGLTGVNLSASSNAGVAVTLSIGPASVTYAANAGASNETTIGATGLESETEATASVGSTTSLGGSLGNGTTGGVSSTATVFVTARNESAAGLKDGTLKIGQKSYVGAGASIGGTASISGGGVTGSAGVTVYSPGSLGLGVESSTGYSDGVVTIGFTFGISLGFGGLEISPSFSFPTANLEAAADAVFDFLVRPKAQQDPCTGNPECFVRRDALSAGQLAQKGPSMELMGYIASHPEVVQYAVSHYDLPGMADLARLDSTYGGVPAQLTSVVQQEQALAKRLKADPGSITLADMQLAQSLRQQEATLIGKASDVGGKVVVTDGTIALVKK